MKKIIFLIIAPIVFCISNVKAQSDSIPKEIYSFVQEMPRFPFGEDSMNRFIANHLIYPKAAKTNKTEGTVVIQFVVDKDGSLVDYKILRDIGDGCGQAVLDVLKKMPSWISGKQRDKKVAVFVTLPVVFTL